MTLPHRFTPAGSGNAFPGELNDLGAEASQRCQEPSRPPGNVLSEQIIYDLACVSDPKRRARMTKIAVFDCLMLEPALAEREELACRLRETVNAHRQQAEAKAELAEADREHTPKTQLVRSPVDEKVSNFYRWLVVAGVMLIVVFTAIELYVVGAPLQGHLPFTQTLPEALAWVWPGVGTTLLLTGAWVLSAPDASKKKRQQTLINVGMAAWAAILFGYAVLGGGLNPIGADAEPSSWLPLAAVTIPAPVVLAIAVIQLKDLLGWLFKRASPEHEALTTDFVLKSEAAIEAEANAGSFAVYHEVVGLLNRQLKRQLKTAFREARAAVNAKHRELEQQAHKDSLAANIRDLQRQLDAI